MQALYQYWLPCLTESKLYTDEESKTDPVMLETIWESVRTFRISKHSSDLIVFSHQWNAMMWPYTNTIDFQKEYITCILSGSVYPFFHKQEKELMLETGCVCV